MPQSYYAYFESPLGILEIAASAISIESIRYVDKIPESDYESHRNLLSCIGQLDDYFAGERSTFDLAWKISGTAFQKSVWQAIAGVPFGTTVSYQSIACSIGNPGAERAVGNACNKNPIVIVIPCHRVVGKSGHLTGYGGGLKRKEWLLVHEKKSGTQAGFNF